MAPNLEVYWVCGIVSNVAIVPTHVAIFADCRLGLRQGHSARSLSFETALGTEFETSLSPCTGRCRVVRSLALDGDGAGCCLLGLSLTSAGK